MFWTIFIVICLVQGVTAVICACFGLTRLD